MVHDFSPYIVQLSGNLGIRWYGVSYLISVLAIFALVSWISRRQRQGLHAKNISDFIIYSAIGWVIGARLGYVIFYSPDLFIKFRFDFPFWGVLAVDNGGMSFFGGIVGLAISLFIFSWRYNISHIYLLDIAGLSLPIGILFNRTASFFSGEMLGKVSPTTFDYAVKFPQEILFWPELDPLKVASLTPLIEKASLASSADWLSWMQKFSSDNLIAEKVQVAIGQLLELVQSGDLSLQSQLGSLLQPRYPIQLLAAFAEGLIIFLILFVFWYKARRPGVIVSTFLILYSSVNFFIEYYLQNAVSTKSFAFLGLTEGQILSVLYLVAGMWMLLIYGRRGFSLPIPGWGLGQNVRIHRRL